MFSPDEAIVKVTERLETWFGHGKRVIRRPTADGRYMIFCGSQTAVIPSFSSNRISGGEVDDVSRLCWKTLDRYLGTDKNQSFEIHAGDNLFPSKGRADRTRKVDLIGQMQASKSRASSGRNGTR